MLRRIVSLSVEAPATLLLTFDDGSSGRVDLAPLIRAGGVFAALGDPAAWRQASVGGGGRWIEWPGGPDLCADALWREVRGLGAIAA